VGLDSVQIVLRRVVFPMLATLAVIGLVVWVIGTLPRWWPGLLPAPTASSTTAAAEATKDVSGFAKAKVLRVVDGDTLDVRLDGAETKLRLLNIDAPETAHDGDPAQCLAKAAKAKLAELAPNGATVRIENYGHDRFGRTLVGLYSERGELLNAQLVGAGLAAPFVVNGQVNLLRPVRAAQAEAAAAGSGLHEPKGCTVPGRVNAAEAAVAELPASATGPDAVAAAKAAKAVQGDLQVLASDLTGDARYVPVDALTKDEVSALSVRVSAASKAVAQVLARLTAKR